MLSIPPNSKVYLSTTSVDFRKQIPGLKKWVQNEMKKDPFSGAYFIFLARNRKSIKIIHFDGQGMCLYWKKLSSGTYKKWVKLHEVTSNYAQVKSVEAQVILMNGNSQNLNIPRNWKDFQ